MSYPEGIATNEVDVWIVDNGTDKVYFYANAASRLSGSQAPDAWFHLATGNDRPSGITMADQTIWVVNDGDCRDDVFVYDLGGNLQGSWRLSYNVHPRGITINPGDVNNIWIADDTYDKVQEYVGGAFFTSGTHSPDAKWALASGNHKPQGIADPPPPTMPAANVSMLIASPWDFHLESLVARDESTLGVVRRDVQQGGVAHHPQRFLADRLTVAVRPTSLAARAADDYMANHDDLDDGLDVFDRLKDDNLFGATDKVWDELGRTDG